MKAVIQNLKTGALQVENVPPPALRPAGVLVSVQRSLVSLGTERAVIALANKGPIGKAMDRPDLFRKVLNKARNEGYWSTYKVVRNLISSPIPLGYSCAGQVIAVGGEATEFRIGDRVACAGLNYANHAEIDYVPRNLAAAIPDGLSYDDACFVTMGAIAMHGMRLAKIELGETVVVMGLGLVGQIAAQLVRCTGATVLATDLDAHKTDLAVQLGAHRAVAAGTDLGGAVAELTGGRGADAVLICAATKSSDPIRQAAELCRLKGRVVVVGDVGMEIERRPYFEKEVTLVVSRSYGPGRYDPAYEERGVDYPLPYVRWTENRNMRSFLELQARGLVNVGSLITHRFAIDEAQMAYAIVTGERKEPAIAIVLEYPDQSPKAPHVSVHAVPAAAAPLTRELRIGVIGAGQFAKGVLLPAFLEQKSVRCHAVCTASGLTSKAVADRYRASYCTSDPGEIIADAAIDAVVIATRHDQHAPLTAAALAGGKAVFVEKPLALTPASLADICQAAPPGQSPRLMVGFNRRFAPLALRCKAFFAGRGEPISVLYRVNAGALPADSWHLDPVQGGGRILGEVCHFVDLISFLTDAQPRRIFAEPLVGPGSADRQNVTITMRMSDGSVGVIHYTANGDASLAKEYVELFGAQRTAILDDYKRLTLYRENRRRRHRLFNQAKGHTEEVAAFVNAVRSGGPMPIDFDTLIAVTQATFLIHESLDSGLAVDYDAPES